LNSFHSSIVSNITYLMMNNLRVLLFTLLALPSAIVAVYEDQYQEYDWQISNIGPSMDHVIYKSKYALASTSEGVLASLNLKTGKTNWRTLQEHSTRVIQMVAGDDVVYTLSQRLDARSHSTTSLVQAWATDSGDLLWDFAHAGGEPSVAGNVQSAMLLDEKQQQLRILDNSQLDQSMLFVLDATKGSLLVQLVSSELEAFIPAEQLAGEDDVQLVFLQLVQDTSSSHVLSGCITGPVDDSAVPPSLCQASFVLDVKLAGVKTRATPVPRMHVFPGFQDVTDYSQIQASISSTQASFADGDVITMASVGPSGLTVSAVLLASQSSISASKKFVGAESVSPVLLKADTSPRIALNACTSSSSSCAVHVLELVGESIEFRELVSCDGSSSVLKLERVATSSGISSAAVCVSISGDSTTCDGTCPSETTPVTLTATSAAAARSSKAVTVSFEYSPVLSAASPDITMTRLRDAFVHRYTAAASGEERLKVMTLSSTGSLHLFQKREKESNTLQWTREEALARVADSVIVDGVSSDPVGHKRVESYGGKIPSLEVRLHMQMIDVRDMLLGWLAQLKMPELEMFKTGQGGTAADRPTLEAFGFNKVAVMFTSLCDVDTATQDALDAADQRLGQPKNCLDGMKVYGVDLISGETMWAFEPVVSALMSSTMTAPFNVFGRLLKVRPHVHGTRGPEITLLLSIESVESGETSLLTYSFNPHTGGATGTTDASLSDSPRRMPSSTHVGLGQVSSLQLHNGDARGVEESNIFMLIHKPFASAAGAPHVTLFPDGAVPNAKNRDVYTQVCATRPVLCSSVVSYRVDFQNALSAPAGSRSTAPTLYPTRVVGSVVFNKQDSNTGEVIGESVVALSYPTAGDPVHSRARVLGDNSLLIKYLNPHLVVVVTEKLRRRHAAVSQNSDIAASAGAGADEEGSAQGGISLAREVTDSGDVASSQSSEKQDDEEDDVDELFVNVIDTVSAQIVHRYSILHASTRFSGRSSVQVSWIENNLLVSYWSTQAQRQELSSVSLFEGMIDKYGLGPFSSGKVDQVRSSFNSPAPIALQKTYVFPRKITSMHHSVTSRGITNKNLLMGLGSGQLYAVDLRMLDPRRPINKPTPAEMEEKLMQYVPFIGLHPFQMLSTNSTLPPVKRILSAPSKLESTSIVVTLGLDVYHTRTVPSKGFDMLASDFNKPLLSLILVSMGAAVVWLRGAYKRQLLSSGWK